MKKEINRESIATKIIKTFKRVKKKDDTYYYTCTDKYKDLVKEVHDDCNILPDDYKYQFIFDALDIISCGNYNEDNYCEGIEADIYNDDLLKWISSARYRPYYVDEVIDEYGYPDEGGFFTLLSTAQYKEREEVFNRVFSYIDKILNGKY